MIPSFERSNALQARLHHVVPGGAHTFAKGADQYPEGMAPVLVRGKGARVWDVDDNEFVEYGMGMRGVTLGHGYAPVLEAVQAVLADGVSFSRPTVLELAAAEDFLAVVPGADMVKFCKNASDATSAALRLARAATGREIVAMCADQPYFSSQDWFVGTLPMNTGVPAAVRSLVRQFRYNDLASLQAILESEPVACVILEAASALAEPEPGFLEGVRALCDRHGTVLVFDETITGFRWAAGGAQAVYGVTPDLSTWGKAMGNGFSIAALAGKRELMELGGLRTARPRAFVLSSTNGAETTGLAAFRAVVRAYTDPAAGPDPIAVMERQGRALADGRQRGGRRDRHRRVPVRTGPPLVPDLPHRRRHGRPVAGDAHAVPAGDPAARGARPVLRDLGGAHRRGRRADRRRSARRDAGLSRGAGDRPTRGAVRRATGRPGTPADGRAAPAGPGRPGGPLPAGSGVPVHV